MPKSLESSDAHKQFFDGVCPDSAEISKLRKLKQDWKFYVTSKSSAENIVEKMKASKPEVPTMLKEKMFMAVLKQVIPDMTHASAESLVPSETRAKKNR